MPVHLSDSLIYRNSWGTEETRAIFDDEPRTRAWLEILAALAGAEAEVGLIPAEAAREVARACRELPLDEGFFEEVRQGFEATNHSTLGLIQAVQRRYPGKAGEWVYYGATVQDITDTWMMMALDKVWAILFRDLRGIEASLLRLAEAHRDTLMAGRTHGQPGLPITFGFKAAVWAREVRRHLQRLKEVKSRLGVGQLAGGVGSLSSLGPRGLAVQEKLFARLGLRPPDITWNTARDVVVEWFQLLTLVSGTADKIGHEVYNLQRPEIGEVSEGFLPGTVGSITMPHKRNPEIAEHLGTLARVIRHNAALIAESQVHDHERDGRAWKAEWAVLAETCLAVAKLLGLTNTMTANLMVHPERMLANLEAGKGYVLSEAVMLALAEKTGKQTAHTLVYETAMKAQEAGRPLKDAVLETLAIRAHLSAEAIESLFDYRKHVGLCPEFVDRVVRLAREERAKEEAIAMAIQLTSSAFAEGQPIPAKYTCDGRDVSPPLKWSNIPSGTKSLALVSDDPDAPAGTWVHWVLYNLPATVAELSEGVPLAETIPAGAAQGRNDFRRLGYGGPCPPRGNPHRYFFKIYALDTPLALQPGATKQELLRAMQGHLLAEGQLMGTYNRK